MNEINNIGKTFDIIFRRYKPIDFHKMEEELKEKTNIYFEKLTQTEEIGKWMDNTRELSYNLKNSEDLETRFLSTHLKLVASGPETLRSKICNKDKPTLFDKVYKNLLNDLTQELNTAITSYEDKNGDAIRGFYLASRLYYSLIKNTEKKSVLPTFSEVVSELKSKGKAVSDNHSKKILYEFFSKYANRPIFNNPELTFVTTYLYRALDEALISKNRWKNLDEQKEFLKVFGKNMEKIGRGFEKDNVYQVYNSLSNLYEYIEGS